MSIVAGVISDCWSQDFLLIKKEIAQHLSRNPTDVRHEYFDNHLYLCRVAIDCYREANWAENHLRFTMVLGHTLMSPSLTQDVNSLLQHNMQDYPKLLADAQGTYCVLNYDKRQHTLSIFADSLAIRPLYYMQYKGAVIFSSCLRLFDKLSVKLTTNLVGVTEYAVVGYTLGNKTHYNEVRSLLPGERLIMTTKELQQQRYFRWADMPFDCLRDSDGISQFDRAFKQAVNLCLGDDFHAISTLSGGLDSRVIVTELLKRGVQLECLNFSYQRSQDEVYAEAFAKYHDFPLHIVNVRDTQEQSIEQRLGCYWRATQYNFYQQVEHPRLVWSGNGGSVCVGMVFCDDEILAACATGEPLAVAKAYLQHQHAFIPKRMVKDGAMLQAQLEQNIVACLEQYSHLPLEKAFQLFLWENDQHQHIAPALEDMDKFRLDFHLPFYSKSVLSVIFALPTASAVKHQFYMKWLNHAYPEALLTPWQTYPGHLTCPLKDHRLSALSQWQLTENVKNRVNLITIGLKTLFDAKGEFYHLHYLGANCLLTALGLYSGESTLNVVKRMNRVLKPHH
ncbi:galactosyl transferase [Photobacterium leiognathi subsp. mandapamensis]|nr:galactosyl transferase [Photobacterium leiognathi subsp. mandapamensis]